MLSKNSAEPLPKASPLKKAKAREAAPVALMSPRDRIEQTPPGSTPPNDPPGTDRPPCFGDSDSFLHLLG